MGVTLANRLCALCMLGFLPVAAFADPAPSPPDTAAAVAAAAVAPDNAVESPHVMPGKTDPVTGITAPEGDGPHSVSTFYPPLARRLNEQGAVKLKFVVTPQGTVANPVVVDSSGFADLDVAATEAVKTWRYKPARKGDVPIAVKLEAIVRFQLMGDNGIPTGVALEVVNMATSDYPPDALVAKEEGQVCILVTVGESGGVTSAMIVRSSNSQRLDQAAMAIVIGHWHFTPATREGKPVTSQTIYVLNWRLPGSDAAEAPTKLLPPRTKP